jgi:hypothetical protein
MNATARRLPDWLADVREVMRNIESDIGNASEAQFLNDGKTLRAVAKSLSEIGEAAKRRTGSWHSLRTGNKTTRQRGSICAASMRCATCLRMATSASTPAWSGPRVKQDLPRLHLLLDSLHQDGPEA